MTTVVVIIVATLALHVLLLVRLARKQAALDRAKAESDFRAGENLARLNFTSRVRAEKSRGAECLRAGILGCARSRV